MDIEAIRESPIGQIVPITGQGSHGEPYEHFAYVPAALPKRPDLLPESWNAVTRATGSLGRLHQACVQLPNPGLLIAPALAREAVSTSALEGTFAPLADVLEARLSGQQPRSAEVAEVRAYETIAWEAFKWVRERPITMGLLSDLQGILAKNSVRPPRDPGKVRDHQVVIGPEGCSVYDARYVPPPPDDRLRAGLDAWQTWITDDLHLPPVLKAAMAHYQFESLHPFGDGNGRIGRLVVVLQLLRDGVLSEPALSLSPWLLRRRNQYQDHLLRLSQTGDWNPWVTFFSQGLHEQAEAHVAVVDQLTGWLDRVRNLLMDRGWSGTIQRLADDLINWPVITMSHAAEAYDVSVPTAKNAIDRLVEVGILEEISGRSYRMVFGATEVIELVDSL